ncbi:MAG: pyrroloquinoline quinone biosynthesis protein PqqE, partial [Eubacterium sp.]|nr:pyrroloquinoline quinone biosynthesis protein PqqE [Eubacterium sp.]
SEGDVEPCVFIHYSDSNIREKSVLECLKSPLFREYYKGQPFNDNMLRPCPMLENPEALVKIVNKTGAKSTNLNCPESVETLCAKCEHYAEHWAPKAKEIWEEKERFHPFTQYYRDTPEGKAELNN